MQWFSLELNLHPNDLDTTQQNRNRKSPNFHNHTNMDYACLNRPLRSASSEVAAFVKLFNRTGRTIVAFWFNYIGKPVHYATLPPDKTLLLNTFHGHPFEFRDQLTLEPMHTNDLPVFWPLPWNVRTLGSTEPPTKRRLVHIDYPLRTLRETALLTLVWQLDGDAERSERLELPQTLQSELVAACDVYRLRRIK